MLKADNQTSTKVLTNLFANICENNTIPEDWEKGLIVKLSKRGQLVDCKNWHGITLLSIPSKVFCRVIFVCTDRAIDEKLRQE